MASEKISLVQLKKELQYLSNQQLIDACTTLAKFKKENKDYLSFLLFNANNLDGYITEVQQQIDEQFDDANFAFYYVAKKSLRKINKYANQQIKFAKNKKVEIEILLHFCKAMKSKKLLKLETVIDNLYLSQIKKIEKAMTYLHEDLQYDYKKIIEDCKKL